MLYRIAPVLTQAVSRRCERANRYRGEVMTAALIAVAALAVVLLAVAVGAGIAARRARASAASAEARTASLTSRLEEAAQLLEQVEKEKRVAESRAAGADGRVRTAEQKATDAERRAGDAERRVAEAMRRAEQAERAAVGGRAAAPVWELERVRMDREWLDVVGPGVPAPLPWDGSIAPVVAAELSVIREVMGTPSDLQTTGPAVFDSPMVAIAMARIAVELLRAAARSGAPMDVVVAGAELKVTQPLYAGEEPPDVSRLAEVARQAGLDLLAERTGDAAVVVLRPAA